MAAEPGGGAAPAAPAAARSYAGGARLLAAGIGLTGLVTFAYFAAASQVLDEDAYGRIGVLWAVLFITVTVIYRPIEQHLSRTIAASGGPSGHVLRDAAVVQAAFAALFLVVAFALRGRLEDALGSDALFWVLVASVVAYAVSYFARGYVAGQQRFGLYAALVLFEALFRVCFPLAVAAGIASGTTAVALGVLAAPLSSLLVVPFLLRRDVAATGRAAPAPPGTGPGVRAGASFAGSVAAIQASEQALLNVAVLLVPSGETAGVVFNAFLITRVPLQLFQSVQTALLPHLASASPEAARQAIRRTVLVMAGLASLVVVGLLALGPWAMDVPFDDDVRYDRWGLAVIAVGMGFHLVAGTLNQGALARGQDRLAAAAWLSAASVFVAWMALEPFADALVRAQVGYAVATALLCALLAALHRRGAATG